MMFNTRAVITEDVMIPTMRVMVHPVSDGIERAQDMRDDGMLSDNQEIRVTIEAKIAKIDAIVTVCFICFPPN